MESPASEEERMKSRRSPANNCLASPRTLPVSGSILRDHRPRYEPWRALKTTVSPCHPPKCTPGRNCCDFKSCDAPVLRGASPSILVIHQSLQADMGRLGSSQPKKRTWRPSEFQTGLAALIIP